MNNKVLDNEFWLEYDAEMNEKDDELVDELPATPKSVLNSEINADFKGVDVPVSEITILNMIYSHFKSNFTTPVASVISYNPHTELWYYKFIVDPLKIKIEWFNIKLLTDFIHVKYWGFKFNETEQKFIFNLNFTF